MTTFEKYTLKFLSLSLSITLLSSGLSFCKYFTEECGTTMSCCCSAEETTNELEFVESCCCIITEPSDYPAEIPVNISTVVEKNSAFAKQHYNTNTYDSFLKGKQHLQSYITFHSPPGSEIYIINSNLRI